MKNIFIMVTVVLFSIATMTTLVSCDSGSTTKTEVVYDGPDTTYMNDGMLFFLQNTPDSIVVKSGDNLWDLSMVKWGDNEWYRFMSLNPFLDDPGRIKYEGGKIIVLIYPGEKLDFSGINDVPVPTRLKETVVTITEKDKDEIWGLPWWAWLIVFVIFLASVFGMVRSIAYDDRYHGATRNANPITQGPPMVEGGMSDANARQLFSNWATQTGRRIGNIFKGKVYSDGRVVPIGYGDRRDRPAPLNGEDAYEVEILNAQGQVTGYKRSLAACCNDIRGGADGLPEYVRFERDADQPTVLNTPQPATTGQPAAAATPQSEQEVQKKIEEKATEKASAGEVLQTIILELQHVSAEEIEVTVGAVTFKARNLNRNTTSIVEEKTSDA